MNLERGENLRPRPAVPRLMWLATNLGRLKMMKVPNWSLSGDKTKLCVNIPTDPPTRFEFEAEETDDFIAGLIALRAVMLPPVPMSDPDRGARIEVTTSGRWYLDPLPGAKALALLLLHPGTRWIGMTMDRDSAEKMQEVLGRLIPALEKSESW